MTSRTCTVSIRCAKCIEEGRVWEVKICRDHQQTLTARLTTPFNDFDESELSWYLQQHVTKDPYAVSRAELAQASMSRYARELHEQIVDKIYQHTPMLDTALQLEICSEPGDASLQSLHWELLQHPDLLCPTRVYRNIVLEPSSGMDRSVSDTDDVDLLFFTARKVVDSLESAEDIDHQVILSPIAKQLVDDRGSQLAHLDVIRPGTSHALQSALSRKRSAGSRYRIIHFDVHGSVRTSSGGSTEHCLKFYSNEDLSQPEWISSKALASLLRGCMPDVVVLNACGSASNRALETSLAEELLKAGCPAVIGMSFEITTQAASLFMAQLYELYFQGNLDLLDCVAKAREALMNDRERLGRFESMIALEDWFVPVLYTANSRQRFQSSTVASRRLPKSPLQMLWRPRTLLNRNHDLYRLESYLFRYKKIEFIGEHGVGISSLLTHAWQQWFRLGMFDETKSTLFTKDTQLIEIAGTMLPRDVADQEGLRVTQDGTGRLVGTLARLHLGGNTDTATTPSVLEYMAKAPLYQRQDPGDHSGPRRYLFVLDDTLEEAHSILKAVSGLEARGDDCYVIIAHSKMHQLFSDFRMLKLSGLQPEYTLELAQQVNRSIAALSRFSEDRFLLDVLLNETLRGNPQCIKSLMALQERLQLQHGTPLRDFCILLWTAPQSFDPYLKDIVFNSSVIHTVREVVQEHFRSNTLQVQLLMSLTLFQLQFYHHAGLWPHTAQRTQYLGNSSTPSEIQSAYLRALEVLEGAGLIWLDLEDGVRTDYRIYAVHPLLSCCLRQLRSESMIEPGSSRLEPTQAPYVLYQYEVLHIVSREPGNMFSNRPYSDYGDFVTNNIFDICNALLIEFGNGRFPAAIIFQVLYHVLQNVNLLEEPNMINVLARTAVNLAAVYVDDNLQAFVTAVHRARLATGSSGGSDDDIPKKDPLYALLVAFLSALWVMVFDLEHYKDRIVLQADAQRCLRIWDAFEPFERFRYEDNDVRVQGAHMMWRVTDVYSATDPQFARSMLDRAKPLANELGDAALYWSLESDCLALDVLAACEDGNVEDYDNALKEFDAMSKQKPPSGKVRSSNPNSTSQWRRFDSAIPMLTKNIAKALKKAPSLAIPVIGNDYLLNRGSVSSLNRDYAAISREQVLEAYSHDSTEDPKVGIQLHQYFFEQARTIGAWDEAILHCREIVRLLAVTQTSMTDIQDIEMAHYLTGAATMSRAHAKISATPAKYDQAITLLKRSIAVLEKHRNESGARLELREALFGLAVTFAMRRADRSCATQAQTDDEADHVLPAHSVFEDHDLSVDELIILLILVHEVIPSWNPCRAEQLLTALWQEVPNVKIIHEVFSPSPKQRSWFLIYDEKTCPRYDLVRRLVMDFVVSRVELDTEKHSISAVLREQPLAVLSRVGIEVGAGRVDQGEGWAREILARFIGALPYTFEELDDLFSRDESMDICSKLPRQFWEEFGRLMFTNEGERPETKYFRPENVMDVWGTGGELFEWGYEVMTGEALEQWAQNKSRIP